MFGRFARRARFRLERWIQMGVFHQLLLMPALIVLVAVAGGLAAWLASPTFANTESHSVSSILGRRVCGTGLSRNRGGECGSPRAGGRRSG